jgi:hypothetical protein
MAKVFTITVPPKLGNKRRERTSDPRYVDGQRLLVEAMKYLAQADPVQNRPGHRIDFRTRPHPLPHERLAAGLGLGTTTLLRPGHSRISAANQRKRQGRLSPSHEQLIHV